MANLLELSNVLQEHIRPQHLPLAVKMAKSPAEVPPKLRHPAKDMGFQSAICQGISIARRYGWALALTREDLSCPLAKVVFGFEEALPYYTEGFACAEMYTESAAAGAVTEAQQPKFPYGAYHAILVAPLTRADFEPDVVVVYGNSAQVMRLVTAALYRRGGRITSSFSGRIDCADIIIQTMQAQDCQVILPCYGDRIFAQTEDSEMAFTIPQGKIPELIEGLKGTYKGGVRYPIPSFLRYQAVFPEKYMKLEELWRQGEKDPC
ncbi:MAG TPA: DUF169 domain-containing protein [Candidatus Tectomicrobia bacterium]|nr:DUF169 domain-containing protein [Candidatus Tectomicrobia bacterium]